MKRREFLGGAGAIATTAFGTGSSRARGQSSSSGSSSDSSSRSRGPRGPRVDIHSHFYPGSYFEKIRELGTADYSFDTDASGTTIIKFRGARFFGIQPPMTDPGLRLEDMDRVGIDVQVLSVSVPNVFFADDTSELEIARVTNDAYAELIARHPTRFKGLASIPMSTPDRALGELTRALDELKLNGVILLSQIRGKPLTDPSFRPFFEEANRRRLCVLIHPMMPTGMAEQLREYVLGPIVGFLFDSTLAVARMCYDGLLRDFPDIRFVIPHLGGAIPYLMARFDRGFHDFVACREKISEPPSTYLKKLYFGTVSTSPYTVEMVRNMVGSSQIALGTDYPHLLGSMEDSVETIEALRIPEYEKERIERGTAMEILNNV